MWVLVFSASALVTPCSRVLTIRCWNRRSVRARVTISGIRDREAHAISSRRPWAPLVRNTAERALLLGVKQLLGRAGGPPLRVVPLRERSLQLLGDEKELDSLLRGRLFGTECLSLELIGAGRFVPALSVVQTSSDLTCCWWRTSRPFTPWAGCWLDIGRWAGSSGRGIRSLSSCQRSRSPRAGGSGTSTIWTLAAWRSGRDAAASAAELGLPPLAPSADLYSLLLRHGHRAKVKGRGPSGSRTRCWLPDELRPAADLLLRGGHRRRRRPSVWTCSPRRAQTDVRRTHQSRCRILESIRIAHLYDAPCRPLSALGLCAGIISSARSKFVRERGRLISSPSRVTRRNCPGTSYVKGNPVIVAKSVPACR